VGGWNFDHGICRLFKLHEKDELKFIGMGGKRVGFLMDVGKLP
jgi:hypothetical protein